MNPAQDRFALRRWDDGIVVYDRHLGDTHAMNPATGCAFRALLNTPGANDEALADAVRQELPNIGHDDLALALGSARGLLRGECPA